MVPAVEDRPSQKGDFVSINLVGKYVDPVQEEDLTSEDLVIELGAEGVQPEFEESLTGVKEGEVKQFTVKYPADFHAQNLAGKTLDFTANVSAVKIKELPELDNEFVEELADEFWRRLQNRRRIARPRAGKSEGQCRCRGRRRTA
ncbi:MAG: FKBP-type peptidyl-prolyl cis-trans isomerase [Blastocatellia bacterium]